MNEKKFIRWSMMRQNIEFNRNKEVARSTRKNIDRLSVNDHKSHKKTTSEKNSWVPSELIHRLDRHGRHCSSHFRGLPRARCRILWTQPRHTSRPRALSCSPPACVDRCPSYGPHSWSLPIEPAVLGSHWAVLPPLSLIPSASPDQLKSLQFSPKTV